MKHPLTYIAFALLSVIIALGFSQLLAHYAHNTSFWVALIVSLTVVITTIGINMLLYARRINPRMKLLPPPFNV